MNVLNPFRLFQIWILNPVQIIRICIRTLRRPFERLEFAFKCFEFGSNGQFAFESFLNASNASNPFRIVRLCIRMFRILFERFEFIYECFVSLSNLSNLHSNASKLVEMVRICIGIPFECFQCFKSVSNGYNLVECFE